ncbi:MAG: GNAT family N-acetyltransferase [archaeon]|nr:GNAT family N-acetyltransferase [archaeon]
MADKKYLAPIISGERVVLKRQNLSFAENMFELVKSNFEHLSEFLPWPKFMETVKDQENWIKTCIEKWENFQEAGYAIFVDDVHIGNIGVLNNNWEHESCEIGYWIGLEFQGNGYIGEAVVALEKELFLVGFNRIIIICDPKNIRSKNIPKKLGYFYEGLARELRKEGDSHVSFEIYSKIKSDF